MMKSIRSLVPSGSARGSHLRWPYALTAALGITVSLACAPPAPAQVLQPDLWVVDGSVDAIAATDSVVYLGGQFSRVGPPTGSWVRVRQSTGTPIQPYA